MNTKCQWCKKELTKQQISLGGKFCSCSCSVSHKNTLSKGKKRSDIFKNKISKAMSGENNPMYGKTHSEDTKKHWSDIRQGKPQKESTKEKWRDGRRAGKNCPMYGKNSWQKGKKNIYSKETLKRMSESAKKHMKTCDRKGFAPNFNLKACEYFEQFDKENNTNGQYATNGGEFKVFIEELNKFVFLDYINHDLRLIIEWDEYYHTFIKDKDLIRENAIKNYFKEFNFKRIKDYR